MLLFTVGLCKASDITTDMTGLQLTEIPDSDSIPNTTTHLLLKSNKICYIPEGALCHITHLTYLNLSHNAMTSLGNLSCVGHSLTHLYLHKYPLKEIPSSALVDLDVLGVLEALHTQLTEFPDL